MKNIRAVRVWVGLVTLVLFAFNNCGQSVEFDSVTATSAIGNNPEIKDPANPVPDDQNQVEKREQEETLPPIMDPIEDGAAPEDIVGVPPVAPPTDDPSVGIDNPIVDNDLPIDPSQPPGDDIGTPSDSEPPQVSQPVPPELDKPAVCDPLNQPDTAPHETAAGIYAELLYAPQKKSFRNLEQFVREGVKADASLFFTEINAPERRFDKGFADQAGNLLANSEGEKLIENFSLRFSGELKLAPDQDAGFYEFAMLADDGAELWLDRGVGMERVIKESSSHNQTHPTRLLCQARNGTGAVYLEPGKSLKFKLNYFQGPRHHIALVLLMRKATQMTHVDGEELQVGRDPQCGHTENNYWFDQHTSKPKKPFNIMTAAPDTLVDGAPGRGWRVLTADNFKLPQQIPYNPCHE